MDKNYEIIDLDKEEIPEYCFKAIFLGDIGVGKTSIITIFNALFFVIHFLFI